MDVSPCLLNCHYDKNALLPYLHDDACLVVGGLSIPTLRGPLVTQLQAAAHRKHRPGHVCYEHSDMPVVRAWRVLIVMQGI